MAASLTASFILKLEDKLSGGIGKLQRQLEKLASLGREVKLAGLDGADRALDAVGAAADRAGRKVGGIGRSAQAAMAELRRLSSQPILVNGAGTAFLPPGMGRAAMAAAIATAAAVGAGGGGGRPPALRPDASFFGSAAPPLLGGPAGGGIPLSFNPAAMRLAGLASGAQQLGSALRQFATQAQQVGQQLGHAAHGALAAAATGFGIYHTVHAAAEVESTLRQAAIAQGLSGPAATQDVSRMLKLISGDATRTGQSLPGLAEAYGDLVARGLPPALVDELIKTHSTAATAYHVNPVDLGQTVYSLNKTLGIGHEDMGGAIAALAQATHAGKFKMGDFARYLPLVAGEMNQLGWTGRGSLDSVASMIEMVSRQSGTSEEAATDFKSFMDALTAKYTVTSFKHVGVDLPARMMAAKKAGKNPVDAYLDILEDLIKGISDPLAQSYKLSNVLHNRQAGSAARAILQQRKEQRELTEQLHAIGADKLARDFATAMAGIEPQLRRLTAEWQVFEMRLGMGFAHLIGPAIDAMHAINAGLDWMDRLLPGVTDKVLTWGGGLAVVSTALGVLIPLFRATWAGTLLLLTPLRWLPAAFSAVNVAAGPVVWALELIALAAAAVWYNWDSIKPHAADAWRGLKIETLEFGKWIDRWTGNALTNTIANIKSLWADVGSTLSSMTTGWGGGFMHLLETIQNAINQLRQSLGLGGAAPVGPGGPADRREDPSRGAGALPGPRAPDPAPPTPEEQRRTGTGMFSPTRYTPPSGGGFGYPPLEIRVAVDGGAKVDAPKRLMPINRGEMLGTSIS